jgi:outer membrane protein assembly factor BamB/enterochelin esterase-like enzyme
MRSHFSLASTLAVWCLALTPTTQANTTWPGLRGPSYDGAVHDAQLFDGEDGNLSIGWIRDLGSGYSVVSVDGRRLIAAFQAGTEDVVAAFDLEHGDELWRQSIGEAYAGHDGSHNGPVATPVLHEGRVFGLGPRGNLYAFDAGNGDPIWSLDLIKELEAEPPFYGFSSSPVVAKGVLVVAIGAGEGKTFGGFSPDTGELLWTTGTDIIAHQSPIVTIIDGDQQVLAVGQKTLVAIDPSSGEEIWSYEHNGDGRAMGGETIVPVPAGEGRLLLMNHHPESVMLQVSREGSSYKVAELWKGGSIKASYVIPVYHDGYLYGMNSKIFTCVDAATGETVWRSREAGDGFPTLVGDHLVIMNKPGTVRVAKASPEGFEEVASLKVFEDHSWSAPAYANGHLYLRSMSQLARVDPSAGEGDAEGANVDWVAATAFGQFLADVENASDKKAAVDAYLAEQSSFPIIEDSGAVHFVYRGTGQDVGIVGDTIGFRREDAMTRVADTDLFHYSTRLEPNAAVSYGFIIDYEEPIADPRNDAVAEGLFGEVSWFAMPSWKAPDFVAEAEPSRQGKIEDYEWESQMGDEAETRKASIYLPAGYASEGERRYPTLYFFDGGDAIENGSVKNVLDNLSGESVQPVIAVFVYTDPETQGGELWEPSQYIEMIATELVPAIDTKYRTLDEPSARAAVGSNNGGDAAFLGGFVHPELFGRVGSLWPVIFGPELAKIMPRADRQPLVVYHTWGTYHIRSPHEAWDQVVENRAFFQKLRESGYRPAGGEVPEGVGWPFFDRYTGDMLVALFPMR